MRNRDLRPTAKANPTIQQAFERFQKYNRLKNLSQGSLDFYAAKGRSFFRFLGDTEQPIQTITEETVEDYIFYMKDQQLHDTTINTNLRMVRAFLYWCMEKGYLEKYPIRLVRADDPIKEPYTTDELQKLLKEPDCKTCSFAEYRNCCCGHMNIVSVYNKVKNMRTGTALYSTSLFDFLRGCVSRVLLERPKHEDGTETLG